MAATGRARCADYRGGGRKPVDGVVVVGMLAIRGGAAFDGVSPVLVERPLVLVDDGRIVDVRAGGAPPPGAEVVDLGGATLLPGLVDAHVHLAFDASTDVVTPLQRDADEVLLERMAGNARTALATGVTTVRDLGDRAFLSLALRERLRADPPSGPELLVAGPPITRTRGHCWFLGGEADTVPQLRAAVRVRAERGCDVVKIMVTGGALTPR